MTSGATRWRGPMRERGICGVSRQRKKVFTTRADPDAVRAPDLVNRDFTAAAPDQLWVTDLTYVPTRSGMAYVCFIVDAFSRRIVGWRVASNMRTEMVLDVLNGQAHPRLTTPRRPRGTRGRRVAVHQRAIHRAARRDRRPPLDRHDRRLVRQRPGRDDQRALQDRVRPRSRRAPDDGTTSTSSSSRRCRGSTGSTTSGCTATAATSRPLSSKQRSTLPNRPTPPGLETQTREPPSDPGRFTRLKRRG